MRRIAFLLVLITLAAAAAFGILQIARGQGAGGSEVIVSSERDGENLREIYAPAEGESANQPMIGFIDSPSATCYQPDPAQDVCYINWYYTSVDASPNYMISMTVAINDFGIVANVAGFFQTSMYVPYNMLDRGFKVACGPLGASGSPYLGKAYAWTIRARDSANLKSANYGTVYCPAYTP